MDYVHLKAFLLGKQGMSEMYQPFIIRALLQHGGQRTTHDLAQDLRAYRGPSAESLTQTIQKLNIWPRKTLSKHGVILDDGSEFFTLNLDVSALSEAQKRELIVLCGEKVRQLQERGG